MYIKEAIHVVLTGCLWECEWTVMKVLYFMDLIFCCVKCFLIAVTRGACNPNLHGVITHVSRVGSQHLF